MIRGMPQSCCRPDYDALFDETMANGDLDDYRKDGPQGETRELIQALRQRGVAGATLLDIGTGSGCIAIILQRRIRKAQVWCCDISSAA